MLDAPPRSMWG